MAPKVASITRIFIQVGIAVLILLNIKPIPTKAHPILLQSLLNGSDRGYIIPGMEFEEFKTSLPHRGKISFITEHDSGIKQEEERLMYDAQNYLVPLLLNPEPAESIAIIYCPNHETAQARLEKLGYVWIKELSPGKGVVKKVS